MPIIATDIKFRLSGGAANADQNASLGGAKSSSEMTSSLFDAVSGDESAAGRVEYRCIYVHNNHGTLTLQGAKLWILANTPSGDTTIDVGLGTSAVNGVEQTVANESAAPSGVTFGAAATEGAAISLTDIPAGQHRAVWLRRTVNAGAGASNDTMSFRVKGDTAA